MYEDRETVSQASLIFTHYLAPQIHYHSLETKRSVKQLKTIISNYIQHQSGQLLNLH